MSEAPLTLTEPVVVDLVPNRLPVVRVTLDGCAPVPFLVDCGAGISVIDADTAEALGLHRRDYATPFRVSGVDGAATNVHRCAYVRRLAVGALTVEDSYVPLLESDLLDVQTVGGILGQDLLARFPLVLDRERGKIHFLPASARRAEIEHYLGDARLGDGDWVITTADFRPCPYLSLDVRGLEGVEIEIDTGAGMTCLPQRVVDALGLERVGGGEAPTLEGPKSVRTFLLRNFGLFGVRVSAEVQATGDSYGLLGMDVLGEFVVVLDAPEKTVWLHRRIAR